MKNASQEKLRGGFYTPPEIAQFILRWAVNGNKQYDILEPSCGDGVFLENIRDSNFEFHSTTAIEIDAQEAEKARRIGLPQTRILNMDFYSYCNMTSDKFDLIVGNPPYVRYQYFDKKQREEAEKIFRRAGIKYSKLMNSWVSFIIGSSLLLKSKGKIGFVVPAELLQVSYAKELRSFLSRFYNKINIVSFKKLVFPHIQQEVILLLCEKNGESTHLIEHLELDDATGLEALDVTKLKSPKKKIDFNSNKWTFYFLEQNEIDFIENLLQKSNIPTIGDYANVEVGMTTGFNKFFTVPVETVSEFNLAEYAKPMVGRSVQVPSVIFTSQDWKNNSKSEARAHFLHFPLLKKLQKNKQAMDYVELGVKQGINEGYKCGIRDEWQIVPSAWVSDALFIRRNNLFPKLVINNAKAYTTDTMHRVSLHQNTKINSAETPDLNAFTGSYYNSLSLAFAEICGRSHGGGVLELMPNEAERILLPYHEDNAKLLPKIDSMMRANKTIDQILEMTDEIILKKNYGFSDKQIKLANKIWKKLMHRRLARGKN